MTGHMACGNRSFGAAVFGAVRSSGRRLSGEVAFVGAQYTELFAIRVWVFLCTNRARLQKMVSKNFEGKIVERGMEVWNSWSLVCDRAHGFWKEYVGAASSVLYGVPDADFLRRSLLLEPNIRNSFQYAFGSFFARTGALAENGV